MELQLFSIMCVNNFLDWVCWNVEMSSLPTEASLLWMDRVSRSKSSDRALNRSEWPCACHGCGMGPTMQVSCSAGVLAANRANYWTLFISGCLAWHRVSTAPDLTKYFGNHSPRQYLLGTWTGVQCRSQYGKTTLAHMHTEWKIKIKIKENAGNQKKNEANVGRKVEKRHDNDQRERWKVTAKLQTTFQLQSQPLLRYVSTSLPWCPHVHIWILLINVLNIA